VTEGCRSRKREFSQLDCEERGFKLQLRTTRESEEHTHMSKKGGGGRRAGRVFASLFDRRRSQIEAKEKRSERKRPPGASGDGSFWVPLETL